MAAPLAVSARERLSNRREAASSGHINGLKSGRPKCPF
jgi:hypothetical protein